MFALSSSPSACIPPVPSRTRSDVASASSTMLAGLADLERRLPGGDVDQEVVPGLRRGSGAPGPHGEGAVLRPELCTCWIGMRGAYSNLDRHMAVELDHSFTTAKPIDESYATILDLERVVPVRRGRQRARGGRPDLRQGRDQGQDGRDVDDVHRHGGDRRAGRRGPSRRDERQVDGGRRPGATRTPTSRSRSRTAAARSTRTRRSPARPRRWARA